MFPTIPNVLALFLTLALLIMNSLIVEGAVGEDIEICKALGIENLYFNYLKYKRCEDGVKDLLTKKDKATILRQAKLLDNFGAETIISAIDTFHLKSWDEATMKILADGIITNKDLDRNSRVEQIKMIANFVERMWWTKVLKSDFLAKFHVFEVIDTLLLNKSFVGYIDAYYIEVMKPNASVCDTEAAMDTFTFIEDFQNSKDAPTQQQDERRMSAQDNTDLLKIVCDPNNKWTKTNLVDIFTKKTFVNLNKDAVKLLLMLIPKILPEIQSKGAYWKYCLDDVIHLVNDTKTKTATEASGLLNAIKDATVLGIVPGRLMDILTKAEEKNASRTEIYNMLMLMSVQHSALKLDKFFDKIESPQVTDFVYNVHKFSKVTNDYPNTGVNILRVFRRAVEMTWDINTMNQGWKTLIAVAELFGKV